MRPAPHEQVEPCARCGLPAERPVIAGGVVAGRAEEHLPLCTDCLQLLLEDVRRFWDGMARGEGPPAG